MVMLMQSWDSPAPAVVAATQFVSGPIKEDIQQAQLADPTL